MNDRGYMGDNSSPKYIRINMILIYEKQSLAKIQKFITDRVSSHCRQIKESYSRQKANLMIFTKEARNPSQIDNYTKEYLNEYKN